LGGTLFTKEGPPNLTFLKAHSYNSILGTGCGYSFAADDAEPSHHFAQESPQPRNLINLVANAYQECRESRRAKRSKIYSVRAIGVPLLIQQFVKVLSDLFMTLAHIRTIQSHTIARSGTTKQSLFR